MTIAISAPVADAAGETARRVSLPRVIRSELIKLGTVRSSYVLLGVTVVLLVAVWSLVALGFVLGSADDPAAVAVRMVLNPYAIGLTAGIGLAQLTAGVLGVIFVTGEYASGMVRATFAAVPTRTPVLVAKAAVLVLVVFAVAMGALLAGFFASSAILSTVGLDRTLWNATMLSSMFGAAFYLAWTALLGASLGWLLRSAAGAVATFVAIFIILPTLMPLVPFEAVRIAQDYLPGVAGQQIFQVPGLLREMIRSEMPAWVGLVIFIGYGLAATLAAALLVRRMDA